MSAIGRYLAGALSAPMTALELICETEDVEAASALVAEAGRREKAPAAREKLTALAAMFTRHVEGCRAIARMLREGSDTASRFQDPARGVEFARTLFDASVTVDEVLAVAMWSLGDREILERATREVVSWARAALPVRATDRVLDFGCGTGRYVAALAPFAERVTGFDLSERMVEVARRTPIANADWFVGSGRALPFESGAFDVVLAIDSFPYVYQGGDVLMREVSREVCRVLATGGRFAILNLAYGDDDARDARVVETIARDTGLVVSLRATRPSLTWTVPAWVLTRKT